MVEPKLRGVRAAEAMLRFERLLWDLGKNRVAGVDEAGLGPLAGPVVAAAVVFARDPGEILEVDDSKKLAAGRRETLDKRIREVAVAVSVGVLEADELDDMGVYRAGLETMRRAVAGLDPQPDYLLVDARRIPGVDIGQTAYNGADGFVYSVAAASIVAKVYRNAIMRGLDRDYPGYGFARHMGYGTSAHLEALSRLGPCPVHRRSYRPVRRLLEGDFAR